jgi:phenylalanyl-tRNA synthetase beta chain
LLVDRGYQEVVNFAFVEEGWEADFSANTDPIRLANPIASQMGVMRSSLIGGLVANLITNLKRKQNRVRLFETGRSFHRDTAASRLRVLANPGSLLAWLSVVPCPKAGVVDLEKLIILTCKGDLEALLAPAQLIFEKLPSSIAPWAFC